MASNNFGFPINPEFDGREKEENPQEVSKEQCGLSFHISNGPSSHRLTMAFSAAYDEEIVVPLHFTLDPHPVCPGKIIPPLFTIPMEVRNVIVVGLAHEDGSNHSFNLTGYCDAPVGDSKEESYFDGMGHYCLNREIVMRRVRFEAYYNAKNRTGTLTIIF